MAFYRLINGGLESAPKAIRHTDGSITANPTEEMLLAAGYYPLEVDEAPEYDPETEALQAYYEQGEAVIYQRWRVVMLPTPEPTAEELLNIILGVTE